MSRQEAPSFKAGRFTAEIERFDNNYEYLTNSIKDYERIIARLEGNIKNPNFSEERRKGFEGLLEVAKQELENRKLELQELLQTGEITYKEETPEEKEQFKRLYKEWESEYKEAK